MEKYGRHGLTLIELIVIIAVIALLLAVIIPSFPPPGPPQYIYCLSRQRSLGIVMQLYYEENNYKMAQGYCPTPTDDITGWQFSWVQPPQDNSGKITGHISSLEQESNGITKGVFWPYIEDESVCHCPADNRYRRVVGNSANAPWRTYSIVAGMNGQWRKDNGGKQLDGKTVYAVHKYDQIKEPGNKIVFMEEAAVTTQQGTPAGYNEGSWRLFKDGTHDSWDSMPANFHNNITTFGFADGHAEKYKWQDRRTIDYINDSQSTSPIQPNNPDLQFISERFIYTGEPDE